MQSNKAKENIMKFNKFTQTILRAVFVLSLFTSQQVLASQQAFILSTSDNRVVGQGTFEEKLDNSAQIEIMLQGQAYSGNGTVKNAGASALKLQRQGMRADRAHLKSMSSKHKKHIEALMLAKDGAKLNCDIDITGSEFGGQCTNPNNEQILSIKTLIGEHS
jgi:hypothetical protein